MWTYHPDLLEVPVPRYTSFPTAAEFGSIEPETYRHALERATGDISLYVHIPFCQKICFYCGCNTGSAGRRQRLESYLDALEQEIALVGSILTAGSRVRRVAFGGGSPNAVTPVDFVRLIDSLTVHFHLADPIWSIELDPRTMTAEWSQVIAAVGIERASLGVQTFATKCQVAIGREQPERLIVQTVDWLREAGVTSLNFDLMYGLPDQSREDLLDTLERSNALGADRIALFGYAHVPHMLPRQRVIDETSLPGQPERFAMAELGHSFLSAEGYVPVGFDHFARPEDPMARAAVSGSLRRNFQGFTDDTDEVLIGVGSSAIGNFPDLLAQNEKNSGRYRMVCSQGQLATASGVVRTAADLKRARMIESLLCQGWATLSPDVRAEIELPLQPFVERGLASLDGSRLAVAPDGLPYARTIAALLDPYRRQFARKFSSAV